MDSVASSRPAAPWANSRLARLGALMCFVVAFGGAAAEIALAWVWLSPDLIKRFLAPAVGVPAEAVALSWTVQLIGFAISMLPLTVLLCALHQAYGLFDAYRRKELFPESAAQRLRHIGSAMLVLAVLRPLTNAMLSTALTFGNPPGQKMVVLAFSLDDYMLAALGGLILAIGHVMVEAKRLADEAREIV